MMVSRERHIDTVESRADLCLSSLSKQPIWADLNLGNFMSHKSDLIHQFTERGYLHQATNLEGLDETATQQIVPTYIGFDCTADSLHVGSLLQIMMLRIVQKSGHKPIVLMGGGTTKVGDPSGKDTARPLLSDQDIEHNKQGIKKVFEKYLTFGDGPTDAVMVDNADWLDNLAYVRFLRDYGPHFSINRMMAMESVKLRLERNSRCLSWNSTTPSFRPMIFWSCADVMAVSLQLGGSDQWGNIVSGIDLTRRVDAQEIFGLTSPLITTASGKNGQISRWRDLAECRKNCRHSISGSSGATPRMPMSAASLRCLPSCRWMR